jgi:hypothetical protein
MAVRMQVPRAAVGVERGGDGLRAPAGDRPHLDHGGAVVGQQPGAPGGRPHAGQIEHGDAAERTARALGPTSSAPTGTEAARRGGGGRLGLGSEMAGQKFFGQAELAAGDDVLLDLRGSRRRWCRSPCSGRSTRPGPSSGRPRLRTRSWAPGPAMSIEALASRLEYSVVNSLYSDASEVGGAPPWDEAKTNLRPSTRATSASVCSQAIWTGSPRRPSVARRPGWSWLHVLGQEVEALGDGRVGEQGEPLEVEGLGDVLETLVELAHHVVVGTNTSSR